MKFCSAYLWEKGKEEYNPVSLVLQQVEVRKQSVLFACVCRGTCTAKVSDDRAALEVECSGYLTEGLVEWFHREALKMLKGKWRTSDLEKGLCREVELLQKEVEDFVQKKESAIRLDLVGMLVVEQWFVMFSQGEVQVHLLNRKFNRKHMRCITDKVETVRWESGTLQKKLGILLSPESFLQGTEQKVAAEVLMADGELTEERLQKRLGELWKGDCVWAVYFQTY